MKEPHTLLIELHATVPCTGRSTVFVNRDFPRHKELEKLLKNKTECNIEVKKFDTIPEIAFEFYLEYPEGVHWLNNLWYLDLRAIASHTIERRYFCMPSIGVDFYDNLKKQLNQFEDVINCLKDF